jgi:small subunit ribosomal protein S1
MSENANPNDPAAAEPAAAEPPASSLQAESADDAAGVEAAAVEETAAEATATNESTPASSEETAAPAEAGPQAAEAKRGAKPAAKSAAKSKTPAKRKPRAPRPTRAEEFVKPTPEELAGIPSDVVRAAVEQELPVGGKVIGWNQGGFHVAVDGISGFCPRSSMELGAPHEPAQYLDKEMLFRVLRVEEKGRRLVLSHAAVLRDERRHQTEEAKKAVQLGSLVKGKVVSLLDFGAFVDLGGFEGLIHVSELRRQRVAHPKDVLEVGQEVEAKVVKLPGKGERVSLSLRALEPDPWEGAAEKWANGEKFTGKIARKSEFGWFVELAPGVEGLLHPSQLPPGLKESDPSLAPGSTIEGWVRELDLERRRVSLALREVPTGNPWQEAGKKYPEGEIVTGKIEKLAPFGAFILLEPGVTGLLPTSEMGLPRGASVGKAYPIGREVKLKVAEVDTRRRRISLTRLEKTLEGSKADLQAFLKQNRKSSGMGAIAAAFERIKT